MAKKLQDYDDLKRFKDALNKSIGDTIRKPISARLGFKDSNGAIFVEVPRERSDQPNKFYFYEAGGTSFQGEAFMQPSALKDWQIRYGTPVRIKKDAVSGEWEIVALDTRYAQQFFDNVSQDDLAIYDYSKLAPGLLTTTEPNTMGAKVLFGAYRLGDVFKYIPTKNTVDWSISPYSANMPTSVQKARYVLVQMNFNTEELEYKYGTEFPSQINFSQIIALDNNTGTYVPQTDAGKFRAGFVKLNYGMTSIQRDNIIPVQEYIAIQSPDAGQNALDTVITWDGGVVVDVISGNLTYTRIEV